MAASAKVDVVGTSPISFTDSTGAQKSVPLSALTFSGSKPDIADDWAPEFTKAADKTTVLAVATARIAAGELTPPPTRPPSPAIAVTASHPGPESNNIVVAVAVTSDASQPLSATIKFSATETDTYTGLTKAAEAAKTIGVDTPSGQSGSPPAGTGVVAVMSSSVATGAVLPADHQHHDGLTSAGFDVKAADSSILFTLVPRTDYSGSGGLSVDVGLDPSGTAFTVTATYNSAAESGNQPKVGILTLNALPSAPCCPRRACPSSFPVVAPVWPRAGSSTPPDR
jgi:hypothetical protein